MNRFGVDFADKIKMFYQTHCNIVGEGLAPPVSLPLEGKVAAKPTDEVCKVYDFRKPNVYIVGADAHIRPFKFSVLKIYRQHRRVAPACATAFYGTTLEVVPYNAADD